MRKVLLELKTQHHALFESTLAEQFLQSKSSLAAVQKTSAVILNYLLENKEKSLEIIRKDKKITEEVREPFFGHIYKKNKEVSPEKVLKDFIRMLKNPLSNFNTVMQMHCIFEYRLFKHLENDAHKRQVKSEMLETLKPADLFSDKARGRFEKNNKPDSTTRLGIVSNPVWAKRLSQSKTLHLPALNRFSPDQQSTVVQNAEKKCMPIVAGYSGHTASLLSGAKIYGELNPAEMAEYAWGCFVFLAAGGNHSFHEVMSIAQLAGVTYTPGNYRSAIPSTITDAGFFKAVNEAFPQYMEEEKNLQCQ